VLARTRCRPCRRPSWARSAAAPPPAGNLRRTWKTPGAAEQAATSRTWKTLGTRLAEECRRGGGMGLWAAAAAPDFGCDETSARGKGGAQREKVRER